MSRFPIAVALAFSMLLAGCNGSDDGRSPLDRIAANWRTLPDGSRFASRCDGPYDLGSDADAALSEAQRAADDAASSASTVADNLRCNYSDNETGMRCWPEGRGFICLGASWSRDVNMLSLAVTQSDTLPDILLGTGADSGFECQAFTGSVTEIVSNGSQRLTSNRIGYDRGPWSRRYVETYLRENDVPAGGRWFDCNRLIRVVREGSLATMATTSIRRSSLPR